MPQQEAKVLEINDWLASEICQGITRALDAVLVFKQTDTPGMIKANARLVVLGFTDPGVGPISNIVKEGTPIEACHVRPQELQAS